MENRAEDRDDHAARSRRAFLARCGKFAAVTPPALTVLLSTSLTSNGIAASAGVDPCIRDGQFVCVVADPDD